MFGINPLMMTPVGPIFPTWNPLDKAAGISLSNSDTTASASVSDNSVRSTVAATRKSHVEIYLDAVPPQFRIGLAPLSFNLAALLGGAGSGSIRYSANGAVVSNGTSLAAIATFTAGDRLMIDFDPAAGKVWFGKNGTWDGNPAAGTGGYSSPTGPLFLTASPGPSGQCTANFGASAFTYTPPSGFSAWG